MCKHFKAVLGNASDIVRRRYIKIIHSKFNFNYRLKKTLSINCLICVLFYRFVTELSV
jgi:hypothetical protein